MILRALCWCLGVLWSAPGLAVVDAECAAIERLFQRNAAAELSALDAQTTRGVAHQQFRLAALYIQEDARKAARAAISSGLRAVKSGLRDNSDDVELLLLGAMLDGERVLINRWTLLTSGLRGMRRLSRAERADPTNPRAALIRGTAKVVLPRFIGGDAQEAVAIFQTAVRDSALCDDGDWGQADILMWLGRAYSRLGEPDQAAAYYQQALERAPDSYWVNKALRGEGYEWVAEE